LTFPTRSWKGLIWSSLLTSISQAVLQDQKHLQKGFWNFRKRSRRKEGFRVWAP